MNTQTAKTGGAIPPLTLGWRLQMALGYAGLSVQEIAETLEVSRTTVSRWINDRGAPRTIYLRQFALLCGVSQDWLITGENPRPDSPDGGEDAVPPLGLEPRTCGLKVRSSTN